MPIFENVKDFKKTLASSSRLLGLDFGDKNIGVSISNDSLSIATPLTVIKRQKLSLDMQEIKNIIEEEKLDAIVIGFPLQMDGSKGLRCRQTYDFACRLERFINYSILLFDERYSTTAMSKFLINRADLSRNKRSKVIDKSAASFILQGAIDAISFVD